MPHRILDIALACGGTVVVEDGRARVTFGGEPGMTVEISASEGLLFDQAVANLEMALGRRGIDLVRGGHLG